MDLFLGSVTRDVQILKNYAYKEYIVLTFANYVKKTSD